MLCKRSVLTRPMRLLAALLMASALCWTPANAAQSAAEAAIQDVIQRGNTAQSQAIAVRDSSVFGETASGPYVQQLAESNQRLLDGGAMAIDLVDLEWGPITVNGASATATTIETWRTMFASGPTEFSRDRNAYTLSLAQDGTWRIVGNTHPDGRSRRTAAPPPTSSDPPPGDAQPGPGTSRNWSGYAARGGSFTSVSATWTVPTIALDGPFGADATWVGIGGLRTRDLIQAGTQQTVSGGGSVTYQAWIEMLPDPSRPVPLTVLPGDRVTVSVDQQDGDTWLISITNNTSNQTLVRNVQYASSLSSAEWIEEAPFARRQVLPISQFGSLSFTSASAVKDGESLTVADLDGRPISLVDAAGRMLAVPSPLGSDGASFTVSRN